MFLQTFRSEPDVHLGIWRHPRVFFFLMSDYRHFCLPKSCLFYVQSLYICSQFQLPCFYYIYNVILL